MACLVSCVNSGKTLPAKWALTAEVRAAARLVARWGWTDAAIEASLLRPVEAEMIARFGPVAGLKLSEEFAGVFLHV